MISSSEEKLARVAAGEQTEILKIVRSIRDELKLVPNNVVDQVADLLKEIELGGGIRTINREGHSNGSPLPAEPVVVENAVIPSDAIDRTSDELANLNAQLQGKRIEMEELSHSVDLKRKDLEGLESQKAGLEEAVADLERAQQKAQSQLLDLESKQASLNEELVECQSMAEQVAGIRSLQEEKDRLLSKEIELLAHCEELKKRNVVTQALLDRLWPLWIKAGDMTEWKTAIESGISDNNSSPEAGLLFAALHAFSAALHDEDPKTLHDSLRDVGRRLYAWLRDGGKTDEEAASIAEKWAQSINRDCQGRGEIEVPVPGHAANNQWMIFQPRGGSSPDVMSVRSWCVRDSLKRPVHRAEVTV